MPIIWIDGCIESGCHRWKLRWLGAETLSVVYSAECKAARKLTREVSLLPILVVLFIFSYAILTMLVVEQGRTIDSQRGMIREMLGDTNQLAALKSKIARDESLKHATPVIPPAVSSNQGKESAPDPSSGKDPKLPGKSPHSMKEGPGRPASDLQDVRRTTRVI
jgi:hypothetical protein